MLYLIKNTSSQSIKIGISKDPRSRLRQLQTAVDAPLELVHAIACDGTPHGDRGCENRLHGMLKMNRCQGEWFRLSEPLLDWLKSIEHGKALYKLW